MTFQFEIRLSGYLEMISQVEIRGLGWMNVEFQLEIAVLEGWKAKFQDRKRTLKDCTETFKFSFRYKKTD